MTDDVIMTLLLALLAAVTSLGRCVTSPDVDVVSMTCSDAAKRCHTDVTCRTMLNVFTQACDESGTNKHRCTMDPEKVCATVVRASLAHSSTHYTLAAPAALLP